ncbi:MAG TPA: glycogen/starch/alpha-glucan phosphorylase [Ruminiclostridium sp.]|nr:glycogen/starch/alpha-glucan phosphorylase [Ruminiclostridium sp.]
MRIIYTKDNIKSSIKTKLEYHFGVTPDTATEEQLYKASAMIVEDILSTGRREFKEEFTKRGKKQVYYLCMEFLMGRSLKNNLFNLGLTEAFEGATKELGFSLDRLYEYEPDAGLGNGGLGRLAACFLDSAASLSYPIMGYSIRYEYGIFRQKIVEGWQTELPDFWLPGGEVWLVPRFDETVKVFFGGQVEEEWHDNYHHVELRNYSSVMAVPYDMMISGYKGRSVSLLRLWSAQNDTIDIGLFNQGDYMRAMEQSAMAEVISKVLYPSDNHLEGKSLRLRQQYFLVSASTQDIIRRHLSLYDTLDNLPEKVAIHINETHPALIIPELMRILLDDCGYEWDKAWDIVTRTVYYTNHTVMNEALEVWPEHIFSTILPRIYQIVKEINERLCKELWNYYPNDFKKISYMAIVAYGQIRMANMCIAASGYVNGVSKIHSKIIKDELFGDYGRTYPQKFCNVTNGISHRRWLCQSNPKLSSLITELIGPGFIENTIELERLKKYQNDKEVLNRLAEIKLENKKRLAAYAKEKQGIIINPNSVFDVQVKRLHEYKRQTLNALHILYLYNKLKANPNLDIIPQTFIFGAKAAPGYYMAKEIIRMICCIAKEIDSDPVISKKLKVVFLEDYRVTLAELLMPASEISEQISLAGTEASGTGNMKLMINGAITIGTLDGANIEMHDAVGDDNILIFGLKADEVENLKKTGYSPTEIYQNNPELREVIDRLNSGIAGVSFKNIEKSLLGGANGQADPYLVLADFNAYVKIHEEAQRRYKDPVLWNKMSLNNIASSGVFSSDRALSEYARNIWHIESAKK